MLVDFSKCEYSDRHGMYGGQAGDKDGIMYEGEYWIVKFPKSTKGMTGDNLASYTTAPLSEYLGSHIYEILGYDVHNTKLGERNNQIVVACKDFREPFEFLMETRSIKNGANKQILEKCGRDLPESATGDNVNLDELLLHFQVNPIFLQFPNVEKRFWECAIIDILIDNNDRNNGNWGLLKNEATGESRLAPIYDNGNSFNNKLSEEQVKNKLNLSTEQKVQFATGIRTSYSRNEHILSPKKFLNIDNANLKAAILTVVPNIKEHLPQISSFINGIPQEFNGKVVFSRERKQLYQEMIDIRFEKILVPAFEKEQSILQARSKTDIPKTSVFKEINEIQAAQNAQKDNNLPQINQSKQKGKKDMSL